MRKLISILCSIILCISCHSDEDIDQLEEINIEIIQENYKGVFTTLDGQERGVLNIKFSENKDFVTATLTLTTGEIITVFTDQIIDLGNRKDIIFISTELSFTMTTSEEGETIQVDAVNFRGSESSIITSINTELAPLTTVTGTFTCDMCPPPLDNTSMESFNFLFTNASGNDTNITTQTTLNGVVYIGVATQSNCSIDGDQTTCSLNSGTTAGVTGIAFTAGDGPVTWSGTHTFDNGPSGADDCSTIAGEWQWDSPILGTIEGAFASDVTNNCTPESAQKRILVFHETNGFRHEGAITNGISMFESLGNENNDWITDNSQDSSVFNSSNLEQYDAVVFLNTSGTDEADDDLLTDSEKEAFEDFIESGKGFIGIHAATDTYRNGVWDFYNELVGGIVQTSPNHTSNNYNADIEVIISHPIIDFLGSENSIWNKDEEYYYWELNGGQLSDDNIVLLQVEQTGNNSYDMARPITWYKESMSYDDDNDEDTPNIMINNIRSFYTALGHNGGDYSNDANFQTMLKNATLWTINTTSTIH